MSSIVIHTKNSITGTYLPHRLFPCCARDRYVSPAWVRTSHPFPCSSSTLTRLPVPFSSLISYHRKNVTVTFSAATRMLIVWQCFCPDQLHYYTHQSSCLYLTLLPVWLRRTCIYVTYTFFVSPAHCLYRSDLCVWNKHLTRSSLLL